MGTELITPGAQVRVLPRSAFLPKTTGLAPDDDEGLGKQELPIVKSMGFKALRSVLAQGHFITGHKLTLGGNIV